MTYGVSSPAGRRRTGKFYLPPAKAGPTCIVVGGPVSVRVHPRVSGADSFKSSGKQGQYGSSPRIRGQLCITAAVAGIPGFIPAYPGLTARSTTPCQRRKVHPRVSGADGLEVLQREAVQGSSPCIRGQRGSGRCPTHRSRFIPVYPGPTVPEVRCLFANQVHPRVSGANVLHEVGVECF